MKKLSIYCIVDVVSETILSVFSAISPEMAKRQFEQALDSNKDKIYDVNDIVLMVPDFYSKTDDSVCGNFTYFVPETYENVKNFFIPYSEFLSSLNSVVKED